MIKRAPRPEGNFYTVHKSISENKGLSWAARGMLVYLLGKHDGWVVSIQDLINQTKSISRRTGRDGVYMIVKELIAAGYMSREETREAGKIVSSTYLVCESLTRDPLTDNPYTENTTLIKKETATKTETATNNETASLPENKKQEQERDRKKLKTLKSFLDSVPPGDRVIPEGHSALRFAAAAGIPPEFTKLAWWSFKRRYAEDDKRYKDWLIVFRKAIEGNWLKLWYVAEDSSYKLTTVGMQAQAAMTGSQAVAR